MGYAVNVRNEMEPFLYLRSRQAEKYDDILKKGKKNVQTMLQRHCMENRERTAI